MKRHGFTLIELLVVVAIISLLMSILLPALGSAKRIAKETICATNIHALTRAWILYAENNRDWFPELSRDPVTDKTFSPICYWMHGYWRNHFTQGGYGVSREMMYSPSNYLWNRDDFWLIDGTEDSDSPCVIGYFCFGNYPKFDTKKFRGDLFNPPDEPEVYLFPRRLGDKSYNNFLWTDLNRQYPAGVADNWVTPKDPNRWGANHLYDPNGWPTISHVGYIDGGVRTIDGKKLKCQVIVSSSEYYWQNK